MAKQPINNGKVVERSYEDYRNNQYLVNRRYQRKLVWELEEKQAFIRVGDFYVTGINGEVEKYYENYDAYILTIRNALNDMPLQDHYRRQIGAKMRHVNYHGKSVIILRITCNSGPAVFDGAYYTRSGPSNDPVPVKAEEMPAFFAQFA